MQTIEVKRRSDFEPTVYKPVGEPKGLDFIGGNAIVTMGGKPVIVQRLLTRSLGSFKDALSRVRYHEGSRSRGLPTRSRVFGYLPRLTIRRDYCTITALAMENPKEHAIICQQAALVDSHYRSVNPELHRRHSELVEKVLPDWRLPGSVFTSGIANYNNPLRYHYDAGNFKGVWSAMLVSKDGVGGGALAVPELGLCFAVPDNSLLMFDGQALLHGVTPIQGMEEGGSRHSVVFYSMEQMWRCDRPALELDRIRNQKTVREQARASGESKSQIARRWKWTEQEGMTSDRPT